MTLTRDDDDRRIAELTRGVSVEQAKQEQWHPAQVVVPLPNPMSAAEARALALVVLAACNLAEQWTLERSPTTSGRRTTTGG
jgi:hypothetical protein